MSTNLQPSQNIVNGITYNTVQNRYELWERGKMTDSRTRSFHPAFDLAIGSATKYPHLTGTAWRGAVVIVEQRLRPQADGSAHFFNGEFIPPYVVRYQMVEDEQNWQYDSRTGRNILQLKRALTCTCESYQRNAPLFKGQRMCKHIWAFQAHQRIEATIAALVGLTAVLNDIYQANRATVAVEGQCCVTCGIQFTAGQAIEKDRCIDDAACSARYRENLEMERLFKANRAHDTYLAEYREWYNSPDGARRYAMVAMANGARSLTPKMYDRVAGRR